MLNGAKRTTILSAIAAVIVVVLFSLSATAVRAADILNQASATYENLDTPVPITVTSPTVRAVLTANPPVIHFYRNNEFGNIAAVTTLGRPLYVQAQAYLCNSDPNVAETHIITITSTKTGDMESFSATETGPNTGLFRVMNPVPTQNSTQANPGDGTLQCVKNDTLTASIEGCGSSTTKTDILVDPQGIVFDSKTGAPVPGAVVTLYDYVAGAPAQVFEVDGTTPAPSAVVTDSAGRYQFPLVAPGIYQLKILPPTGYTVPSTVPIAQLPPGHSIDPDGSYLRSFKVTLAGGTVYLDVPADPRLDTNKFGLFVQVTGSRSEAEIGDTIVYTIDVKNVYGKLLEVNLGDTLPAGFTYKEGSTTFDGIPQTDKASIKGQSVKAVPTVTAKGPQLLFNLGTMADGQVIHVQFRASIGPGAPQGDGMDYAQATSTSVVPKVKSNIGTWKVKMLEKSGIGVFNDRATVIGKVFVDENHNRVQDDGELGIPGVRLYVEDGAYVVTDSEGKFSIYGLTPRTHVLKVDYTTMPHGSKLEVLNTRNADYPGTVFLDLKRFELQKANFAEGTASKEVLDEVNRRRSKGEVETAELDRTLKDQLTADGVVVAPSDIRALPASGVVGGPATANPANPTVPAATEPAVVTNKTAAFTPLLPQNTLNSRNSNLPESVVPMVPTVNLEHSVTNLDNKLAFIDFKDNDTMPMAQTTVRVKGTLGTKLILRVNGEEVGKSHVGKRVELADRQLQAVEFIGVTLKPGQNTFELSMADNFGNVRGTQTIHVTAPDRLGRIKIILPGKDQPADGNTPAKITVLLQDDKGVAVTARTPLTLETSNGRWNVEDLDKKEPGTQVFIEGGKAVFELLPPGTPGDANIVVSSGILEDRAMLPFLPDLRPMLAVGVVEGTLNLSKLSASKLVPARRDDGFEEELRNLSVSSNDEKLNAAARTAFFLKGKIKGEYLLTAGFDSAKQKERLFRDIQPDTFYPVYGDSSIRGYDAQSTGKLYVRVDNKRSYLLYGDFNTAAVNSEVQGLGNYNRSLNGVREHYENGKITANIWASQDSTRQVIEELPANGTSGPFFFNIHDAVAGSEVIQIIVRDRNQPSIVLSESKALQRFIDYEFEPFTGRILLKGPVSSFDRELNPIYIRATFEVDQGGDKFWVYGGDAQVKINNHWQVGGSAVHDDNPMLRYDLRSVNTTVKLTEKTYVIGEVAQSDTDINGVGNAGRVEVRHQNAHTDARVYIGKTEANFTNTASILQPGRVEGGFKVTEKLKPSVSLVTEGVWTEDVNNTGSRKGVRADIVKTWGQYSLTVGGRHSQETKEPASPSTFGVTPNEVNSVRAKFSMPIPKLKNGSVYGEYENDVKHTDERVVAVGGDFRVQNKTKVYARHEFISSLGGPLELNSTQQRNTTIVGVETEYMKDGNLFNEYRARDAFEGREAEASTGLRNLWNVAEGVRINTTLERVTPVVNGKDQESTAVTGAIEYTRNPESKTTARLELRTANANDSLLNTLGYARKVSRDWTFLGKTILLLQANKGPGTGDKQQGRFQAGMAYRQTETDKWNALFKYEYKYENDETQPASALERQANILMADLNYQATADLVLNLHYATKLAFENGPTYEDTAIAHLIGGRAIYDISKHWDVGFNFNTLFDEGFTHQQFAFGPEVGFIIQKNLRIAVGYNVTGFRDRDLGDGYTNQGLYVNLRLKFDETLFKRKEEKE